MAKNGNNNFFDDAQKNSAGHESERATKKSRFIGKELRPGRDRIKGVEFKSTPQKGQMQEREEELLPSDLPLEYEEEEIHPSKQTLKKKKKQIAASQDGAATDTAPKHILFWRISRPLLSVVIGLVVVGLGVYLGITYAYQHYFSPVDKNSTEQIEFVVEKNSSLNTIAQNLEEAGLVRSGTVFKYYVDFSDMGSDLLAGKFTLSPSMTFDDIISALKRPTEVNDVVRLTFAEGISVEGYGKLFVQEGILKNDKSLLEIAGEGSDYDKYYFIQEVIEKQKNSSGKRNYILEGYLFPDTYDFYTTSDEDMIITKLLNRFDEIFTAEYQERAEELGMTVDEVITLASIIEKESKQADFKKVSAVFHNRLKQNIALGSCATHQYFMPVKKLVYTQEELLVESPYNTYINKGLPIGPICNPGKAAIEAALYPDETFVKDGYLYFCLGNPETGETVFAKTNEEHEANKAKYAPLWEEYQNKYMSGN